MAVSTDGTITSTLCLQTFPGLAGSDYYLLLILTEVSHKPGHSRGVMFEAWLYSVT